MTAKRPGLTAADYARAERFLPGNELSRVPGSEVRVNWINHGSHFWYRNIIESGTEFILVDTTSGKRDRAFDHDRLAAELSRTTGTLLEPYSLPFESIEFDDALDSIQFEFDERTWSWSLQAHGLSETDPKSTGNANGGTSPDGRWSIAVEDFNLRLTNLKTGEQAWLTEDGVAGNSYGTPLESPLSEAGIADDDRWSMSSVLWSPDSRLALSFRLTTEGAQTFHWLQTCPLDGSRRPKLHTRHYPLPGDDPVPSARLMIFDVERGAGTELQVDPIPLLYYGSPLREDRFWWSRDCATLHVLMQSRGYQEYGFFAVDTESGESKLLITERDPERATDLHVSLMGRPQVTICEDADRILWLSQEDGWAHLYWHDLQSGSRIHQVTNGSWSVVNVYYVDQESQHIFFTAVGREAGIDPYFALLYRIGFDGGEPEIISTEHAYHDISFAPDGSCFVDTCSRIDMAQVTTLREPNGGVKCLLESADITSLQATGWSPPERFRFKARDGVTDVYGVLFLPTWYDPGSGDSLPVLDDIYAGPHTTRAPASFAGIVNHIPRQSAGYWHAQANAELGFAVVMIDGLGMPYRSKRFQARSFRDLADGGLAEHVLGIRSLGAKYPFLDTERVGIYGHSAGGYSSMNAMLRYPDFYKVAVSSAGNHDHRLDKASWIERYMGLPVGDHYHQQANATRADQLKGKLLLIHGEMDENVHVASTMQLVDALIDANKDFDMLILPNRPHACVDDPYFIRRRWDYFVTHLLGIQPPPGYQIGLAK